MAAQAVCRGAYLSTVQSACYGAVWLIHRPWPPSRRPALHQRQPEGCGMHRRINPGNKRACVPSLGGGGSRCSLPAPGVSAAKYSQGSVSCARETHGLRRRFVSVFAFPACWDVGGCMCHRPSAPVLRVANHCLRITKRPDRPCEKPGHGTFWFRVPALAATRRHSGLRRALHVGGPRKWATATLQFQHASLAFRSRSRSSGNLSGSASRAYHWQVESVR
jgi:hypothetical protein